MSFVVATFYHFFDFPDFAEKQQPLKDRLKSLAVKGSLLITPEGFNGTIAGSREGIDGCLNYLRTEIVGNEFKYKESYCEKDPFIRTKVRLKKELIGLGEEVPPQHTASPKTGTFIAPKDWDDVINAPDTLLLDTRNRYETHMGTFKNAVDPDIRTFKALPDYVRTHLDPQKHKKIATFCTGGVRCEKLTGWMLEQGFEEVYQLEGGILKYLEEVPKEKSSWEGECYVFDKRVAVGHGMVASQTASMCIACGTALTPEDRQHPEYIENKHCPYCEAEKAEAKKIHAQKAQV